MATKIRSEDFADVLQWVALALFIVFLAILLSAILPLEILDSRWQVRVISALLGSSSLPLIGVVMMLLANYLHEEFSPFGAKIRLLRRLAGFAAIGFLLLIPLQITAGSRLLNQQSGNEVGQLKVLQAAAEAIRSANNEADLKNALRQLPGAPNNLDRPLAAPLPQVKAAVISRLDPAVKRLETQVEEAKKNRFLKALSIWIRDAGMAAGYAIGFSSLGSLKGQGSLLRSVIPNRRKSSWNL
ncbi:MAG: hypothetical protein NTZ40_10595 [Cyanobacteria bacterium]|nr:hypothetical protein [Cyanobacteriota bacterium]